MDERLANIFFRLARGNGTYLPEHHTDLVFATLSEEWGLVGGLVLLLTYFWLFRWGFHTASIAPSRFGKLVAGGLTATLFFYVAMNMLTATAITPIMGVPLPLISHGGSAMMTIMLLVGLIMAIDRPARQRGSTQPL